ncbi:MAG: MiaB/RimO family radical SAM methylthiotransferase [Oscillospiraceae bacterium]
MKFSFYTLGCKVNQYETQAMQQMLLSHGHTLGEFDEPCDGYIVNSCTVTAVSDKKTRNAIRRAQKLNPNAAVGVCGCYAQSAPEEVRALGVDVMVGTADREAFVLQMEQAAQDKASHAHWEKVEPSGLPRAFEQLPAGGLAARTRALLKIEDGCNSFCTYCIIPYARGRVRSMPLEAAVEETKRLAREGYREIVINGIEISSWGWEWKDGSRLPQLLLAVCQAAPDVRIRLGSLEPRTIDEEFCTMLSGCKNLCPQFHLSLQSGSDTVLKRMNRKYDTTRYLESVRLLHEYFPNCAVTTDLIVGFPAKPSRNFPIRFLSCRPAALPPSTSSPTPAARERLPHPCRSKSKDPKRSAAPLSPEKSPPSSIRPSSRSKSAPSTTFSSSRPKTAISPAIP